MRNVDPGVTVFDGTTVVVGGQAPGGLASVDDKVPVLSGIPLVGRLFQGNPSQPSPTVLEFVWVLDVPESMKLDPLTLLEHDSSTPARTSLTIPDGAVKSWESASWGQGLNDFVVEYPFTGKGVTIGSGHSQTTSNGLPGNSDDKPKMHLALKSEIVPGGFQYGISGYFPDISNSTGPKKGPLPIAAAGTTPEGVPVVFDVTPAKDGRKFVGIMVFKMADSKLLAGSLTIQGGSASTAAGAKRASGHQFGGGN